MSSMEGLVAEQRTRQKSDPHDTNAVDVLVELDVIRADVVPILTACQAKRVASRDISGRGQCNEKDTYFDQLQEMVN
jgi:hypothetical protein